jgi:hypothetical protein
MNNGVIDISVTGFHFSSPKIVAKRALDSGSTAKLTSNFGDDWSENQLQPVNAVAPNVPKKTTVTCIKGKKIKKVTAVKPLCPIGYKKR